MKVHKKIAQTELPLLRPLIADYLAGTKALQAYYTFEPNEASVKKVIDAKKDFRHREILVACLQKQYKNFKLSEAAQKNLERILLPETFTVCTAHQLCLFTGPSYFIYKIASVIKLCKDLKAQFPQQNFVPVYWMGSEDHDIEEMNHTVVFGKKLTWENDEKGAVGKRSLSGLDKVIEELAEILGEQATHFIANLQQHFSGNKTYGEAFQAWILDLFKEEGLVVLDQNDAQLKSLMIDVFEDELLNEQAEKVWLPKQAFLETHYHKQAHARPINLFYLQDGLRERIEKQANQYKVLNTELVFSEAEILDDLHKHPEKFSPNVILRPLYQETVLPNVAFVGGPGELAYWLQEKDVFEWHKRIQPLIVLRDMCVVLAKNQWEKWENTGLHEKDLFTDFSIISKRIIDKESEHELNVETEKKAMRTLFESMKAKAILIDKNLDKTVEAELQRGINSLENLASKLVKAEKKNFETQLIQLEKIQEKVFPNQVFQERRDSFINVYTRNPENYFNDLIENMSPMKNQVTFFEA
jgi:bacillithiol biosynthesis cysteine-adding enzyme BshC